jgi:hypothetical protein
VATLSSSNQSHRNVKEKDKKNHKIDVKEHINKSILTTLPSPIKITVTKTTTLITYPAYKKDTSMSKHFYINQNPAH